MTHIRRRTRRHRTRQAWTAEEIRTLKKIFRNMRTIDVADELERTLGSVQGKASYLGLLKTRKHLKSIGRAI